MTPRIPAGILLVGLLVVVPVLAALGPSKWQPRRQPPQEQGKHAPELGKRAQQPAKRAQKPLKRDTIKLKNGYILEGEILHEDEDTVTIRVGPGQQIELSKRRISTYARVSDSNGTATYEAHGRLKPRNAWFRIKNADGRVVGTLHLLARREEKGHYRLEEQWVFFEKTQRTIVSRIETVDPKLHPLTCFYREAVIERSTKKVTSEKIRRGRVLGEKLELHRIDKEARRKRLIPFPAGNLFPLLVEELLRQGEARGARTYHASIFDPMDSLFELRRYDLAEGVQLPEALFGKPSVRPGRARLIHIRSGGRSKREWLSVEGRILLIEVNGVDLVAEPVAAEVATKLHAPEKMRAQPAHKMFAELDIWLPRATWRFGPLVRERILELMPAAPNSRVRVYHQKSRGGTTHLQTVAENFLKRWKLEEPWFKEKRQEVRQVEGRAWVEIQGGGKHKDGKLRLAKALVCETVTGHLMLVAEGPSPTWPEVAEEFGDFVEGIAQSLRDRERTLAPGK